MPRPCDHPAGSYVAGCKWCRIARSHSGYRRLWDGTSSATTAAPTRSARSRPRCVHLGEPTGELRPCAGCGPKGTKAKVQECAVFGECTWLLQVKGLACCKGCTAYIGPNP